MYGLPVYAINDSSLFRSLGSPSMRQNINNNYVMAGGAETLATCAAQTAVPGCPTCGCATAGPSSMLDISNDPDHTRCASGSCASQPSVPSQAKLGYLSRLYMQNAKLQQAVGLM